MNPCAMDQPFLDTCKSPWNGVVTLCAVMTWLWALPLSASAQGLWDRFVPVDRVDSEAGDYPLTRENGPWLIMAASFKGEGGEEQARALVGELRERYNLPAYLHYMSFDLGEAPDLGIDKYGGRIRGQFQLGDQVSEFAVLVGNFPALDDPQAQALLERIKTLESKAMSVDPEVSAQSLAELREKQESLLARLKKQRPSGPMHKAFLIRNPLLPREYFVPRGVSEFVAQMNAGIQHSLLDCPGQYSVQVASFRGRAVLESATTITGRHSALRRRQAEEKDALVEAAENAHLLTLFLRAKGWEAYEFHDRHESVVTVGSFDQVGTQNANGEVVPLSEVATIIRTFGPSRESPFSGTRGAQQAVEITKMLAGQHLVNGITPQYVLLELGKGETRTILFEVRPHPIEVPRQSLSSVYARQQR